MVLELEEFEQSGPFVGGGHELQLAVGICQQQADGGDVDELGCPNGHVAQELDQVEVVHQGVRDLDEDLGQSFS